MAATALHTKDIFDFEVIPPIKGKLAFSGNAIPQSGIQVHHPKAGEIAINTCSLPFLHIMNLNWHTASGDILLHDSTPGDCININFMMGGHMHSNFKGLKHDLDMKALRHNLIYLPEGGGVNLVKGYETISMLHLTFDKEFLASAIGYDDQWSERIQKEILQQRPFSGINGTSTVTPLMAQLVDSIRQCPASGPMRNLLLQSRALELLALQIEQFKTPVRGKETIRPDEAEKLYQLKAYLDTNFLADLNLTQLSRQCLLNEFKLKKGFKAVFGTTVFGYIRKLRMEYAAKLLKDCVLTVDEVADALGYEHSQHFSIAFKNYMGVSPSVYRHK
ncbi:AraC family transcriptional regulator [Pontibacter sp. SGAir0037]|uniref:AraC family transcriptional regulator n=1 Tax=Pontibacter sp. SGAir0037 TaxID=2571030 RepID=UPI0010CD565D|nr:AraC family transcriptional regulator [Pontibacter sp. SGAir0037]QCR23153.1 AraC family transcriptional regulator [Pontibacter sp. SGAir0037]